MKKQTNIGDTPLHVASRKGKYGTIRTLLNANVGVLSRNLQG